MKTATAHTSIAPMLHTPTALNILEGKPKIPEPITPSIKSKTRAHLLM